MNNITKYSKEDLLNYLPDFISGDISDISLNEELIRVIQSDMDFKKEYDTIKMSLNFLKNSDLEEPDNVYFNNLSVRINQRIDSESVRAIESGSAPGFSRFWKFIIPALTVILVFLYINFFQDNNLKMNADSENNKVTKNTGSDNNINDNKNESVLNQDAPLKIIEDKKFDEQKVSPQKSGINNNYVKSSGIEPEKNYDLPVIETPESNFETNGNEDLKNEFYITGLADFLDTEIEIDTDETLDLFESSELENINSSSGEDQNLKNDFRELSPSEQQEILNILKKTQI